jgi:hypothetical protein
MAASLIAHASAPLMHEIQAGAMPWASAMVSPSPSMAVNAHAATAAVPSSWSITDPSVKKVAAGISPSGRFTHTKMPSSRS